MWRERDRTVPSLDDKDDLDQALALLEYALTVRMYGECAPGGSETWQAWDTSVEHYLRRIRGFEE